MEGCELRAHEEKPWFTVLRAAFMWKGRDYERALQALEEAGPLDEKATNKAVLAFARVSGDFHDAVGEIYAMTSERKDDVSDVLDGLANGQLERAETRLQALLEQDDWNPLAKQFLQTKLSGIAFHRAFTSGEWVRLDGDAEALDDWRPTRGRWEVDEQGRIVGSASEYGLMLLYKHKIAGPYELVCDAEVIGSKAKTKWANLGLIGRYKTDSNLYAYWVFPNDMRAAGEWHGWHDSGARGFVKPGINEIKIRHSAQRQVTVMTNGKKFQQFDCSHLGSEQSFGISSLTKSMGRGRGAPKDFSELQVRYSNIRIRSLPDR
jgi:hypothetical protein